jgi:uncharacterized protein YciI
MIFAVIRRRGGPWNWSKPIEEQSAWPEHADYMDRHHEAGAIGLAGPLGDQRKVLLIVRANSVEEVERLLTADPWTEMGLLETDTIQPWTLRLGSLDQTSSTNRP